ncbi:MAG: hypothetical protein MZV70_02845 [Desulfobacterales bacterium]|nr:hypothetical protein [Desulfobacterales bacterium]
MRARWERIGGGQVSLVPGGERRAARRKPAPAKSAPPGPGGGREPARGWSTSAGRVDLTTLLQQVAERCRGGLPVRPHGAAGAGRLGHSPRQPLGPAGGRPPAGDEPDAILFEPAAADGESVSRCPRASSTPSITLVKSPRRRRRPAPHFRHRAHRHQRLHPARLRDFQAAHGDRDQGGGPGC